VGGFEKSGNPFEDGASIPFYGSLTIADCTRLLGTRDLFWRWSEGLREPTAWRSGNLFDFNL